MISFRKIYPADYGVWERVERLYADAFPRIERRAACEMRRLAECGRLHVCAIMFSEMGHDGAFSADCAVADAVGSDGAVCTGSAAVSVGTDGGTVAAAGECGGTVGSAGRGTGGGMGIGTDKGANNCAADNIAAGAAGEFCGEFCGFITWWDFGGFVYGEHFAMLPECRGAGIGGEVIDRFVADAGKPVVLEVELPTNDTARRRIGFYERHGFTLCDAEYVQPPYDAGGEGVPMRLMSHGMSLDAETFERVRDTLYAEVYGVAE